jgi:hypothetical protein
MPTEQPFEANYDGEWSEIDEAGEELPVNDERREQGPLIIAAIVAAIGALCLWSDLKSDTLGRGDGIITSEVVARAGATIAPSEQSAHLISRQTVLASEPSTVGQATP